MAKEAQKRKAAEKVEAEPPTKKGAKDAPKDSGDVEKNEPADKRPVTKTSIAFNGAGTTLNVIPSFDGKVLMALTEGGMQYLIAGARGSAGMKAGRYAFEIKIIEALNPAESAQAMKGRTPHPRQLARVGFSTASSSLILGDSDECAYFDSEGNFAAGKTKKMCSSTFTRDQVICVVLNIDPKSPNANTMSIFREGVRLAEPQPLPECLHGKPLFPHICFRNVTVQVNLGPTLLKPLPFSCRTIQAAAGADIVESSEVPKDGKYEVVLPVGVPDEGTFDWLDGFLEENPTYVELSERKLQAWAASSGLTKQKAAAASNDKPAWSYGIPSMDDQSLMKVANSVAATIPRNYVVMEVKSNLIAEERTATTQKFNLPHFKKTAMVVMGEPPQAFKDKNHAILLQDKQMKSDAAWKVKKAEAERQKAIKKRQKALEKMKKQAEEQRKKNMEAAQKKLEEAAKKKAEEEAKKKAEEEAKAKPDGEEGAKESTEGGEDTTQKMEVDEVKEETKETAEAEKKEETAADAKDETKEETKEEAKEEAKEEEEEEEEDDGLGEEPPKVELTEEDKKQAFRPKIANGDLQPAVFNKFFAKFAVPEQSEGFGEVKYVWDDEETSKTYLRKWVLEAKRTTRIEDLQPSKYFTEKLAAWKKQFADWQAKQKAFKAAPKKDAGEEKKPKDLASIEDINDIGDGEPAYASFEPEDWALLQLRYEVFLLADAYKKDLDDPDRQQIPEVHLAFYYSKYYNKQLNPGIFTLKTVAELVDLVKSTATITDEPRMLALKSEDAEETLDSFVKKTEEARRERKRRSDAGDETALLKYNAVLAQASQARPINTQARATPAISAVRPGAMPGVRPGAVPGVRPVMAGPRPFGLAGLLAPGARPAGIRPAGAWAGGKW